MTEEQQESVPKERMVKRVTVLTEEQAYITLGLCISQLRLDGFNPEEIAVVSHLDADSLANRTKEVVPEMGEFFVDVEAFEEGSGLIRYGKIEAFEGIELPAVIVTDVYDPDKQLQGGGSGTATLQGVAEAVATQSLVTITFDPNAEQVA